MERTLVLLKPDAVERGLIGEIIARFERKGLSIVEMRVETLTSSDAEAHYAEHAGKDFFEGLCSFITSGPLVKIILQGTDAVRVVRAMIGKTNPNDAAPGTIRGDLASVTRRNLVHASDSLESAEREIALHFPLSHA